MSITLTRSCVISAVIHIAAITPLYSVDIMQERPHRQNDLVVDYIQMMDEAPAVNVHAAVTLEPQKEIIAPVKTRPLRARPVEAPRPAETAQAERDRQAKQQAVQQAKAEERVRSTKDYVNYYQLIREKIRLKLKDNYRYYQKEGDIYLRFVLKSDGTLPAYEIDQSISSADDTLRNITTVSLIESAPFTPFPAGMKLDRMTFNLMVSFRKK